MITFRVVLDLIENLILSQVFDRESQTESAENDSKRWSNVRVNC